MAIRVCPTNARTAAQTRSGKISARVSRRAHHVCRIDWGFEHLRVAIESCAMAGAQTNATEFKTRTKAPITLRPSGDRCAINFAGSTTPTGNKLAHVRRCNWLRAWRRVKDSMPNGPERKRPGRINARLFRIDPAGPIMVCLYLHIWLPHVEAARRSSSLP